jgi:hypothetical protein
MQYEMDQNTLNRLSEQGMVLLNAGIPPSAAQLEAMGMTADQANTIIAQQKLAAAQNDPYTPDGNTNIEGLFEAALTQDNPWTWIKNNYKRYGLTAQPDKSEFDAYVSANTYDAADVSAAAKAWATDLYKYYGSQEDRLNAIYREYNGGESWMTQADMLYLLDTFNLR